jgi:excisionase family DNA binding protein
MTEKAKNPAIKIETLTKTFNSKRRCRISRRVQTVYLWVERKQIPHLRVMGRNIRFLKSDLEAFRARFRQEVGIG